MVKTNLFRLARAPSFRVTMVLLSAMLVAFISAFTVLSALRAHRSRLLAKRGSRRSSRGSPTPRTSRSPTPVPVARPIPIPRRSTLAGSATPRFET